MQCLSKELINCFIFLVEIIADEPQEIVEESIIEGEANSEREKNPESKSNDETGKEDEQHSLF